MKVTIKRNRFKHFEDMTITSINVKDWTLLNLGIIALAENYIKCGMDEEDLLPVLKMVLDLNADLPAPRNQIASRIVRDAMIERGMI